MLARRFVSTQRTLVKEASIASLLPKAESQSLFKDHNDERVHATTPTPARSAKSLQSVYSLQYLNGESASKPFDVPSSKLQK
ncbi:hypothetical protein SDRG_10602 [Saprolegnia diclina VS20]|uniref:Uncharacterized protein n=1 Tax=Saprolegnia diclina (strain VS20) TaxID=1156394 RepID=T0RHM0_SAPDV|nr:hypothetical protein SDRG_10602 [Saprolegnia diclina VS20]EQC31813.1 hypothetical protein SDRG_10602 [Saprolegnia diclina VS20]|eukprot:XP_008614820.1 hypothetical protein SDRG_10602 [Saprolegnia diclina VS20]